MTQNIGLRVHQLFTMNTVWQTVILSYLFTQLDLVFILWVKMT